MDILERQPFVGTTVATLLDWAHQSPVPIKELRPLAGWLKSDDSIRAYLEGAVQGNIHRWKFGSFPFEREQ